MCLFTIPTFPPFLPLFPHSFVAEWHWRFFPFLPHVHILSNKDISCSLFPALLLSLPSIFFSKLSPLISMMFSSTLLPGFSSTPRSLSQRSGAVNSGVCHCMLAAELKTVHNYVTRRNLGETRVRRHRSIERERERRR